MLERDEASPDLVRVLATTESAAPVDAVQVVALEIGKHVAASDVSFLIADYSGNALVRLTRSGAGPDRRSRGGEDAATTVPLAGTDYETALHHQRVQVVPEGDGFAVLAPVTNRGDVIGVLDLRVFERPGDSTLDIVGALAHILGYVVIANERFTDLFEWGQRSSPMSIAGEIQRRLLPDALSCEAGQFTIAGALEPTGDVGGDTFDYSLERETLHVSLTDAMGHGTDAALLATLLVGCLRNSRRAGDSLARQAAAANTALTERSNIDQYASGQLLRVDLGTGSAHIVNAGHPSPLRLRNGRVEAIDLDVHLPFGVLAGTTYQAQPLTLQPGDRLVLFTDGLFERGRVNIDVAGLIAGTSSRHPREVVRELTRAALEGSRDGLHDDATALCLDWYSAGDRGRDADTGADHHIATNS